MFDPRTVSTFLSVSLLLQLSSAFYLKEDRYKKRVREYEKVETITDPVKVKLLMSQPAKEEIKFTQVLIPDKFSRYDSIDQDGHITLKELIKTTGAEYNAQNAFQAADEDADGEISQEEFKKAPWAMKPASVNSRDDKDFTEEAKIENVIVEEEVEADEEVKVGVNRKGRDDIDVEGDEERDAETVDEAEKVLIRKDFARDNEKENKLERVEEKNVELGAGSEREDEDIDRKIIDGEDAKELLEEAEGKPVGEGRNAVGVENSATEKNILRGGVRKVDVEEEEGMGKTGNAENVGNETAEIGGGKEKEENNDIEEKENEEESVKADNRTESKYKDYIEIEDLETHIHSSNFETELRKLGSIPDKTGGQFKGRDHLIEEDLENRKLIDAEESSGEFKKSLYNQEGYSDEERNTSEENYESFIE